MSVAVSVFVCVCVGVFTFRGLSLGFLWRPEAEGFAWRTRPVRADGLHVHDVVSLCLQVPQCTAPCGGVHFLYEAQHVHILFLSSEKWTKTKKRSIVSHFQYVML